MLKVCPAREGDGGGEGLCCVAGCDGVRTLFVAGTRRARDARLQLQLRPFRMQRLFSSHLDAVLSRPRQWVICSSRGGRESAQRVWQRGGEERELEREKGGWGSCRSTPATRAKLSNISVCLHARTALLPGRRYSVQAREWEISQSGTQPAACVRCRRHCCGMPRRKYGGRSPFAVRRSPFA